MNYKNSLYELTGLNFIKFITENCEITIKSDLYNEKEIRMAEEKLKKILSTMKESYIHSTRAKAIENENKKIKTEIEEIKKQKKEGFKEQYKYEIERMKKQQEERDLRDREYFEEIKREYEEELERTQREHEKHLNKWKAMYTGQSEANQKIINNYIPKALIQLNIANLKEQKKENPNEKEKLTYQIDVLKRLLREEC